MPYAARAWFLVLFVLFALLIAPIRTQVRTKTIYAQDNMEPVSVHVKEVRRERGDHDEKGAHRLKNYRRIRQPAAETTDGNVVTPFPEKSLETTAVMVTD